MISDVVIIGGGPAGLAAAIGLTEQGIYPLVLEAGCYPAHKICGEFISPEALPLLKKWGIHPTPITHVEFHLPHLQYDFPFPQMAGGYSRFSLDAQLADYARKRGAVIQTETSVQSINPPSINNFHEITLADGTTIQSKRLIVAMGRIPSHQTKKLKMPYIGLKAHYEGVNSKETLKMFSFPGTYIGISPIEKGKCNVACLVKRDLFEKFPSSHHFIQQLMSQNGVFKATLSEGNCLFPEWLCTQAPPFGVRATPSWQQTYFVGDAAGTIHPAAGDGLAMSLCSGYRLAQYVARHEEKEWKKMWQKTYSPIILCGKVFHTILFHPFLGRNLIRINQLFPPLSKQIYHFTRQSRLFH